MKFYQIMFIIIVFRLGCDRPSGLLLFVPAVLFSILTPLLCPSSSFSLSYFICCYHACVFGKTLVHEFPVSCSHTKIQMLACVPKIHVEFHIKSLSRVLSQRSYQVPNQICGSYFVVKLDDLYCVYFLCT